MKTPKLLASLTLLCSCAASLQSVASAQQIAAPVAPAPSPLEIQISAPINNGKRFLVLDPTQPHFNVILRNASDQPLQIIQEGNSWGYSNLHLEITAIDGKTLPKPLLVTRGPRAWRRNAMTTETLNPNEAIVREVYLHVPLAIKNPGKPLTTQEQMNDQMSTGDAYRGFPFSMQSQRNTVTMKAVYEVKAASSPLTAKVLRWTGRIESAPLTYEIFWSAPRR